MMHRTTLRYDTIALELAAPEAVLAEVTGALHPFFVSADSPVEVLASVTAHASPPPASLAPVGDGETVAVDTSLYKHLASSGLRWETEDEIGVRIDLGESWVRIDKVRARVDLWQPDPARLAIELQRLVKSLITPALELTGAVQCHSAAVTVAQGGADPAAVLLLGDMWQGKTTVLLELLAGFAVRQLSCDTTVVMPGADGPRVRGWPSPFSMSHGTMSDHRALHPFIPEERHALSYDALWREGTKSVLTSDEVTRLFGTAIEPAAERIAAALVLRFRQDEPVSLDPIDDEAEVREALTATYLGSRDPIYHNWHRWIVCPEDRIDANLARMAAALRAAVPFHRVTWAPSVASLLKRIDCLGAAHKDLGPLLFAGPGEGNR